MCKQKRNRVIIYSSSSDSEENTDGAKQDDVIDIECPLPMEPHDDDQHSSGCRESQAESARGATPDLDPELLLALGDPADEQPAIGEKIHNSLEQSWMPILVKGHVKEQKEKLLKEFPIPENCKLLKAPSLNPEIKAAVSEIVANRDKNIQIKQDQLGFGITAINKAISLLLLGGDKIQTVKILSDGCRILTDLHYIDTQVRTKLITSCPDKAFTPLIKDHERDGMLFGEKLSETFKASKAIQRQGLQIQKFAQRTPSAPASIAGPSTYSTWFPGNDTRSLRYLSGNRGGGRGLPRTATSYRRGAPAPTGSITKSRAFPSQSSQRSHERQ